MKRIIALLTVCVMVLGCAAASAENTRHEHVFAVLGPDGTVQSLTDSIMLENADALDTMEDRTALTNIQNVSGRETFTREGETLIWQANGANITYQGTSDRELPFTPVVTLTLDGEEVTAEDLAGKTGNAELTVTYQSAGEAPHLAATLILLPEAGVSNLALENAFAETVSGRKAVIGWGVPGADASLNLPASFKVRFTADHAQLNWLMTFASADPIDAVCRELLPMVINKLNSGLDELNTGANSLADGAAELKTGTDTLKTGVGRVSEGASGLYDGSVTLADGAEAVNTGLAALTASSAELNGGADAIFAALLDTANQQIADSGLSLLGIEVPELTADNYSQVLSGLIDQMPMGIHTVLSESAGTISGGQQQRILIARAIISHPSILIFDEATSALDNLTQAAISKNLDEMNITRIVVAHRLSTIKNCKRIIVLQEGRIAEDGDYDSLMKKRGLFYQQASRQLVDEGDGI